VVGVGRDMRYMPSFFEAFKPVGGTDLISSKYGVNIEPTVSLSKSRGEIENTGRRATGIGSAQALEPWRQES